MPRKAYSPLPPVSKLITHILRNTIFGLIFIVVALYIGMLGYHGFEKMSWIDAFVSAAMILAGMGPISPLTTFNGKLFAGLYALFSGLLFIAIIVIIFSPLIHRFFHKLHLQIDKED
jgi:hypothetical protein